MNFHLKIKDTITVGVLAGIMGSIQISIVNFIFLALGFTITPGWKPFAELISRNYAHTLLGVMVGLLGQTCNCSLWGVFIAYILKFTGKDFWWLKGLGVGAIAWLTTTGLISRMLHLAETSHRPGDQFMIPFNLFLFGFIVAYLTKQFGSFKTDWH